MNTRLLTFLAGLAALGTSLGALDLSGFTSIFPAGWAKWFAIIPPLGAALVHFALAWGDYLDDGKKNDSFKVKCPPVTFVLALILSLSALVFTSCAQNGGPLIPIRLALDDPDSGLSASYSAKGGLGLSYTTPAPRRILSEK